MFSLLKSFLKKCIFAIDEIEKRGYNINNGFGESDGLIPANLTDEQFVME